MVGLADTVNKKLVETQKEICEQKKEISEIKDEQKKKEKEKENELNQNKRKFSYCKERRVNIVNIGQETTIGKTVVDKLTSIDNKLVDLFRKNKAEERSKKFNEQKTIDFQDVNGLDKELEEKLKKTETEIAKEAEKNKKKIDLKKNNIINKRSQVGYVRV